MRIKAQLGGRIRALRRQAGLTQAALAERLGISTSYVNLLENDRRAVTADLLLSLAQVLDVDLRSLAAGPDEQLLADAMEVFGDPVLEEQPLTAADVRSLVESHPEAVRSVVHLHQAYSAARSTAELLQAQVLDDPDLLYGARVADRARLSSEQVTDFLQRHSNHFPELESAAERVWAAAQLAGTDLFGGMARYLEARHGATVRVTPMSAMDGAVRRYRQARGDLLVSEALARSSRSFQLAVQIGLLECPDLLASLVAGPELPTDEARSIGRLALANYFAAALLMPYDRFLAAAESERYDIAVLCHRFDIGWEQVCHRFTTLRRPGAEGVEFFFIRVDPAGNISKRLSAAGVHIPRFSGLCTLWNVQLALLQPGRVSVQLAELPDGRRVLCIARTVQRHVGGFHTPRVVYAVGIGCASADARRLVYSDGLDLDSTEPVPIGITCRLCERVSCQARAFPSLHQPIRLDENVRGLSFYDAPGS